MRLRDGMTSRIYDSPGWTIAIGGAYVADGSHRRPVIDVYRRKAWPDSCVAGTVSSRRVARVPLPHVRFHRCFRYRRVGGMIVYRLYSRAMHRLCQNPRGGLK